MTCVSGHMTDAQFVDGYKDWRHPPPERLFSAPVKTEVSPVSLVSYERE